MSIKIAEPTSKLLGFTSSVIGYQQGSVVLNKSLLEGVLGVLVDELLVVCDDRLGNGLSDCVDLGSVTTSGNSDTDIDVGKLVETDNQEWFVDLESQDLGLDEVEGLSINLDDTFTSLFPYSQRISFSHSVVASTHCLVPCSGRRR